jgi:hypothetical protein
MTPRCHVAIRWGVDDCRHDSEFEHAYDRADEDPCAEVNPPSLCGVPRLAMVGGHFGTARRHRLLKADEKGREVCASPMRSLQPVTGHVNEEPVGRRQRSRQTLSAPPSAAPANS